MTDQIRTVRTACPQHCANGYCGALAHVDNGKVVKLEPGFFPDPQLNRLCLRGIASTRLLYHPDRLQHPLIRSGERGEGKWRRASWDEAIDAVAEGFRRVAEKYGPESVAWVLGGPGSGTVKFGTYLRLAALTGGTRVSCFGYGDSAGLVATKAVFGTHIPGPYTAGVENPDLIIYWGTNPAEAQPFLMRDIWPAKEQGVPIVVIDPRFTGTAAKADQYVPIRPGTDAALALSMIDVIVRRDRHDRAFIRRHSVGPFLVREDNGKFLRERDVVPGGGSGCMVWDEAVGKATVAPSDPQSAALTGSYPVGGIACRPAFALIADLAAEYPPSKAADVTGVPAALIEKLALSYVSAKAARIYHHMGLQRGFYGDLSVRAMSVLAAVCGHIALPGSQAHRQWVLNWDAFLRPGPPGYRRIGIIDIYDAIMKGEPHRIKATYFAFINFVNQCANSDRIRRELIGNLDFIVSADMFMTDTTKYADVVLPVCTWLEHSDLIVGPNPYLQLQQRVVPPLYESRSDVDIASAIAHRMGLGEHFDKTEEELVDVLLASGDASVEGITVASLRQGPQAAKGPEASTGHGRFKTPSGKIELYVEQLLPFGEALPVYKEPIESNRQPLAERYPLVFVQGHTRFRTHSMFANVDWTAQINPDPEVEINPKDATPREINDGDTVDVFNDRGATRLKAKVTEAVQPGVVNICEGWWGSQFAKGGVNDLTHETINPAQAAIYEANMALNDVLVEVRKVAPSPLPPKQESREGRVVA